MATVVAIALAGAGIGAALYARRGPDLAPRRIAVAVFENQTGDPALDPLGRMAADWITQGLTQTQLLDVVPSTSTLDAGRTGAQDGATGTHTGADRLRALAAATGAGTVVSGAYYREGDSLRFQAQVTDAGRSKLLRAMEPVSGDVARPTAVIERLRQRVTAALAALVDPKLAEMAWNNIEPPSYEAYREYMLGLERFYRFEYPEAITHLARAAALDSTTSQSTHNQALVWAGIAYVNQGQPTEGDSVAQLLAVRRERLTPLERHSLNWMLATIRGDNVAALEQARGMLALTPGSDLSEYLRGVAAMRANRPGEAVVAFTGIDERGPFSERPAYWNQLTGAYHMLGDHRRELAAARRARERFPTLPTLRVEVRALAAAGEVAKVEERLGASRTLSPQLGTTPATVMEVAALELRAHGHGGAAQAAAERAIQWYRARGPQEQAMPAHQLGLGRTLYTAGRWEEARAVFDALVAGMPDNPEYLGYLGVLAARRGDRAEAARVSARLAELKQRYLNGRHTFWRSRIAAVLGDRERAVELLVEAFQQGVAHDATVHTVIDFEPLHDYAPFQELLRPAG